VLKLQFRQICFTECHILVISRNVKKCWGILWTSDTINRLQWYQALFYEYMTEQSRMNSFTFWWPCISLQILANNQLDALFHVFIYFISLHVSSITVLIIRRSNCINILSGMISLFKWLLGMPVRWKILTGIPSSHLHRLIIPDNILIHLDLLIMSTVMLETCREMK